MKEQELRLQIMQMVIGLGKKSLTPSINTATGFTNNNFTSEDLNVILQNAYEIEEYIFKGKHVVIN